jgi:hypothetical protein
VNVQLVNGEGHTATTNGEGNLVLGYDENPGEQTGSHDLVVGRPDFHQLREPSLRPIQRSHRPCASVTGGVDNTASAWGASGT